MVRRVVPVLLLALILCGCGGVLPRSKTTTPSSWRDFDEAKASYDSIVPGETTTAELYSMGFDPASTANLRRLNYVELIEVFMPHPSILRYDLDPALRECLEAREACFGYEAHPSVTRKQRHGNVLLDLLTIRRETSTRGWHFKSLIVINGDIVAYKLWSGEPLQAREDVETVPLGPLQNAGGKIINKAVD